MKGVTLPDMMLFRLRKTFTLGATSAARGERFKRLAVALLLISLAPTGPRAAAQSPPADARVRLPTGLFLDTAGTSIDA